MVADRQGLIRLRALIVLTGIERQLLRKELPAGPRFAGTPSEPAFSNSL